MRRIEENDLSLLIVSSRGEKTSILENQLGNRPPHTAWIMSKKWRHSKSWGCWTTQLRAKPSFPTMRTPNRFEGWWSTRISKHAHSHLRWGRHKRSEWARRFTRWLDMKINGQNWTIVIINSPSTRNRHQDRRRNIWRKSTVQTLSAVVFKQRLIMSFSIQATMGITRWVVTPGIISIPVELYAVAMCICQAII